MERIGSEEDWDKQVMENFVEFVVSVADGWDESQQRVLKMAMVEGGLVTARKADDNVHFIREAEVHRSQPLDVLCKLTKACPIRRAFISYWRNLVM